MASLSSALRELTYISYPNGELRLLCVIHDYKLQDYHLERENKQTPPREMAHYVLRTLGA